MTVICQLCPQYPEEGEELQLGPLIFLLSALEFQRARTQGVHRNPGAVLSPVQGQAALPLSPWGPVRWPHDTFLPLATSVTGAPPAGWPKPSL